MLTNGDLFGHYVPLISILGEAEVRYIGLVQNGFMIGFVGDLGNYNGTCRTILALPFQDISAEILEYKCHGWNESNADKLSTPNKTEWKTNLNVPAYTSIMQSDEHGLKKPLFKMVGESLEDGGSKPQFSSNMAYSGLSFGVPFESFGENLPSEFPNMFRDFSDSSSSTLAIETVVKVTVNSATDPDGFKVGVVQS
jgi:hypothetical protein